MNDRQQRIADLLDGSDGIREVPDADVIHLVDEHLRRLGVYYQGGPTACSGVRVPSMVKMDFAMGIVRPPERWQRAHEAAMDYVERLGPRLDEDAVTQLTESARAAARRAVTSMQSPVPGPFAGQHNQADYEAIVGFLVLGQVLAAVVDDEVNPYEPLARLANRGAFLFCVLDDGKAVVWRR